MPCSHSFFCVVAADIYYAALELVKEAILVDGALGHNMDLQGSLTHSLCGLREAYKSTSANGK